MASSGPGRTRRSGISSEVSDEPYVKKVHPKTAEERARVSSFVRENILFKHLDQKQMADIVDAFFSVKKKAGENIIVQGDDADNYFVLEKGQCDVLVNGKKVTKYTPGSAFGELALMYNNKRAATVKATSAVECWALDRGSFNFIVKSTGSSKRKATIDFLSKVSLLQGIKLEELNKLVDIVEEQEYDDGSSIIRQGEIGDAFYILLEGECVALKDGVEVLAYKKGDCFGERALLTDQPRAATILPRGTCKVGRIPREAFDRLLGPCQELMTRHMESMGYSGVGDSSGRLVGGAGYSEPVYTAQPSPPEPIYTSPVSPNTPHLSQPVYTAQPPPPVYIPPPQAISTPSSHPPPPVFQHPTQMPPRSPLTPRQPLVALTPYESISTKGLPPLQRLALLENDLEYLSHAVMRTEFPEHDFHSTSRAPPTPLSPRSHLAAAPPRSNMDRAKIQILNNIYDNMQESGPTDEELLATTDSVMLELLSLSETARRDLERMQRDHKETDTRLATPRKYPPPPAAALSFTPAPYSPGPPSPTASQHPSYSPPPPAVPLRASEHFSLQQKKFHNSLAALQNYLNS